MASLLNMEVNAMKSQINWISTFYFGNLDSPAGRICVNHIGKYFCTFRCVSKHVRGDKSVFEFSLSNA